MKSINIKLTEALVKKALELDLHIHNCGSNGGDAFHYILDLGQVKLYFSNHDILEFGVNLYNQEFGGLYAPKLEKVNL